MGRNYNKQARLDLINRCWELRRVGKSHHAIAAELKLSTQTVFEYLQLRGREVAAAIRENVEAMKAEQTAVHEHIRAEALAAWERSKEDAEKVRVKKTGVAGGSVEQPKPGEDFDPEEIPGGLYIDSETGDEIPAEERARRVAEAALAHSASDSSSAPPLVAMEEVSEVKGQVGNAVYLKTAMDAMEAERRIWGLDAPKPDAGAVNVVVKLYQETDLTKEV